MAKPWCCDISSQQGNTKLRSNQMKLRGISEMSKSEIFISWFNDLNLTVMHAKHINSKRWLMVFGWFLNPIFKKTFGYWGSILLGALKFVIKQIVDYLIRGALYLVNFVFEPAAKNSLATGVRRERT